MIRALYRRALSQRTRDHVFLFRKHVEWRLTGKRRATQGQAHHLPNELIVSLTSYPPRYGTLALTIRSLLDQIVKPDKLVLWAQGGELPREVTELQSLGLVIEKGTDGLNSYNKLIPALLRWPHAYFVIADDDAEYPRDWLETLVSAHDPNVPEVLCRRGHLVRRDSSGQVLPYENWGWETAETASSFDILPTGVGGVLYPPGSLHPDATREELFLQLAPTADDLWFYWQARRNGYNFRRVGSSFTPVIWPGSQHVALAMENADEREGNTTQYRRLAERYGT